MMISVPVSVGELFDKITILRLKAARITDPAKSDDIAYELEALERIADAEVPRSSELARLIEELQEVNAQLWDIEDGKRAAERSQDFGAEFVALARAVYRENDHRAAIKRRINLLLGSRIVEHKSHADT